MKLFNGSVLPMWISAGHFSPFARPIGAAHKIQEKNINDLFPSESLHSFVFEKLWKRDEIPAEIQSRRMMMWPLILFLLVFFTLLVTDAEFYQEGSERTILSPHPFLRHFITAKTLDENKILLFSNVQYCWMTHWRRLEWFFGTYLCFKNTLFTNKMEFYPQSSSYTT